MADLLAVTTRSDLLPDFHSIMNPNRCQELCAIGILRTICKSAAEAIMSVSREALMVVSRRWVLSHLADLALRSGQGP